MRGCEAIAIELPGYVGEKLDAVTAAAVRSHLQTCSACKAEVRELEGLDRLLEVGLGSIEPSPTFASSFANRLAAQVRAEEEHHERRSWLSWLMQPWLIPVTAAAVLGAIIFSSWYPAGERGGMPAVSSPGAMAKKQAPEGKPADGRGGARGEIGVASSNPPTDLIQRPELFMDYAVIRDLDVLESSGDAAGGKAG